MVLGRGFVWCCVAVLFGVCLDVDFLWLKRVFLRVLAGFFALWTWGNLDVLVLEWVWCGVRFFALEWQEVSFLFIVAELQSSRRDQSREQEVGGVAFGASRRDRSFRRVAIAGQSGFFCVLLFFTSRPWLLSRRDCCSWVTFFAFCSLVHSNTSSGLVVKLDSLSNPATGEPMDVTVKFGALRPVPPTVLVEYKEFDNVDVWNHHGWWKGMTGGMNANDLYFVMLEDGTPLRVYDFSLRINQTFFHGDPSQWQYNKR
ncbi:hypothetical protein L2E82_48740 [Cichorium intybus]|uniref:Uncharacterized protein n=1 Tax=Cichorium intybus TaxID=13427 RepID=A0ACB8YZT4_CICIN|nr:hypothetical protein L2E82_48740 [Cichorium intybus]